MNLKDQTVLVVCDEPETSRICVEAVGRLGCREVLVFPDDEKVVEYLEAGRPARLVVIDLDLPHHAGVALVSFVAGGKFPGASNVSMVTLIQKLGLGDTEILAKSGVLAIVPKPLTEQSFLLRVREQSALTSPSSANAEFIARVQAHFQRAKYAEAQQILEQELAAHPGVAKYHVLYLRVLLEMAQDEQAEILARKLLPKAEHYTPLLLVMAALQVKRRNFAEAISFLERSRLCVPLSVERLTLQAESHFLAGNYEEAEGRLRRVEKVFGKCEVVRAGLARVLAARNRLDEARSLQREMDDPSEPYQAHILRGVLLAQAGKQEEAIAMYQKAMFFLIEPGKAPTVLYNIALGYFKLKQYGNCKEFCERCLTTTPTFERAKQLLAKVAVVAAQPEGAAACVAPAVTLAPDQLLFLQQVRFVRPSGLPFKLEDQEGDELYDKQGNVVKQKEDTSVLKYDSEATKGNSNIFRGAK